MGKCLVLGELFLKKKESKNIGFAPELAMVDGSISKRRAVNVYIFRIFKIECIRHYHK